MSPVKKVCLIVLIASVIAAITYIAATIYKDGIKPVENTTRETSAGKKDVKRQNKEASDKKKRVIGVSVMNYKNEYWLDLIDGVKTFSKEAGYEVIPVQVNDSVEQQVETFEEFIDKGVDGIIIAAIDETALEPVIHDAMDKGIKVIGHLHDLKECNVLYGPKEYDMGFLAGRYMGRLLKENGVEKPRLAMFRYPELGTLVDREKGLEDGLREFVPETVIVSKVRGDTPELGEKEARVIIKNHPDINGFIGINDNGLLGALKAADETGISKRKDFFIVGIGGDSPALDKIKGDTPYKATVNTDPWLNGYNEAKYLKELFDGSNYNNKAVYFSPLDVIDGANVDEVLKEKEKRKILLKGKE